MLPQDVETARERSRRDNIAKAENPSKDSLNGFKLLCAYCFLLVAGVWYVFLAAISATVFKYHNILVTEVDSAALCSARPFQEECLKTQICNTIFVFVLIYALIGFVISICLTCMVFSIYKSYFGCFKKKSENDPTFFKSSSGVSDMHKFARLCMRCEPLDETCIVNTTRRITSGCICPLVVSFLIGSIMVILNFKVMKHEQIDVIEACHVEAFVNSSEDDVDEEFLDQLSFAMFFTKITYMIHWLVFALLVVWGCGASLHGKLRRGTPVDSSDMKDKIPIN
mmetsp:Transcript_13902/g.18172  ORF Transcript_13902/g.18172 Transcript_13902/m.18172 type:complete len:282 (+) Transcript_13902:96-941(+)